MVYRPSVLLYQAADNGNAEHASLFSVSNLMAVLESLICCGLHGYKEYCGRSIYFRRPKAQLMLVKVRVQRERLPLIWAAHHVGLVLARRKTLLELESLPREWKQWTSHCEEEHKTHTIFRTQMVCKCLSCEVCVSVIFTGCFQIPVTVCAQSIANTLAS